MNRIGVLIASISLSILMGGCVTKRVTDSRGENERIIRESEIAAAKALAAKDLDGFVSFYADDASLLLEGSPIITGKDAIRERWKSNFERPGFSMSFEPVTVEASSSGDLAYVRGIYTLTVNDDAGKSVTENGKYVVIYKKGPDGVWKIVLDTGNADPAGR